jgi:hypothetical protein
VDFLKKASPNLSKTFGRGVVIVFCMVLRLLEKAP